MKKVLCLGSVTTDIFVRPVDELPPPGVLKKVSSNEIHVGGCASNAAIDLAVLGVPVALGCKCGDDYFGKFVEETSRNAGVDTAGVVFDPNVETTTSIVLVNSSGERTFLYNCGSASRYSDADVPDSLLEDADIVFIAGAMLLDDFDGEPAARVMRRAKAMGKFTVMDTAWDHAGEWLPKIAAVLPELDLFMPSREEAEKLSGETDPDKMADFFFAQGCKNVVIKLGSKGALICEAGQPRVTVPTYLSVKPKDTTGAGDSFCAGFLAGLATGKSFLEAGKLGNAVGTHCIMEIGASTGIRPLAEIYQFMEDHKAEVE
ncbi:MAG: carbohydrate kinase family protein [Oscillospiraceae bacterium]|nr:carbohydrate kinase family protein [Oscillospiraceae bacterium]